MHDICSLFWRRFSFVLRKVVELQARRPVLTSAKRRQTVVLSYWDRRVGYLALQDTVLDKATTFSGGVWSMGPLLGVQDIM